MWTTTTTNERFLIHKSLSMISPLMILSCICMHNIHWIHSKKNLNHESSSSSYFLFFHSLMMHSQWNNYDEIKKNCLLFSIHQNQLQFFFAVFILNISSVRWRRQFVFFQYKNDNNVNDDFRNPDNKKKDCYHLWKLMEKNKYFCLKFKFRLNEKYLQRTTMPTNENIFPVFV